jgi:hypothetical protein
LVKSIPIYGSEANAPARSIDDSVTLGMERRLNILSSLSRCGQLYKEHCN